VKKFRRKPQFPPLGFLVLFCSTQKNNIPGLFPVREFPPERPLLPCGAKLLTLFGIGPKAPLFTGDSLHIYESLCTLRMCVAKMTFQQQLPARSRRISDRSRKKILLRREAPS
jgi:hypothetical protein